MHTTSKRITRCKHNSSTLQTKELHAANKAPARCKRKNYTLQTKLSHTANKTPARCKQKNYYTLQTKLPHTANKTKNTARAGWRKGLGSRGSRGCHENSDPSNFKKKKGLVNSSEFLSPNALWSCNVHRQQPERSKIVIFSGLSLSHRSNSENLTRFKIAADILMAFAGEFLTEEIEDTESL